MRKSILIFLFALLGVLSAHAYDFEVDGIYYDYREGWNDNTWKWEIIDGEVEVTFQEYKKASYSGSVVIPSTVTYSGTTYTVTSIGNYAFEGCSGLTSLMIPNSVTSIGYYAFYGCSGLTSVTIPERVTSIGNYAFEGCSGLTSVTIPERVTSIEDGAFKGCSGLTSVTIPERVTSIGTSAFEGCSGLTSVIIPESVTFIGAGAFYGTSISSPLYKSNIFAYMPKEYKGSYTIPDGIQSIAGKAFSGCSGLTSVTIPESVTSIEDGAFKGCSGLTSVTIPESVTYIGDGAFWGCSGLTSVTIPDGVITIRMATFAGCSGLTTVTIPDSVTSIGERAFAGCSGLTTVTIPDSVTSIGYMAFFGCSGLKSVTIPNGMTSIGHSAFEGCSGLTSVTSLAKMPPFCSSSAFVFDDYYTIPLYVPRGCKAAYQRAEGWDKFTTIYESGFDGTGLITVQPNDTTMGRVTGGGEYEIDKEITIEAIPNAGYHFIKWDDENTDNPRTLTVIADITLTAIFEKDEENPDNPDNPNDPDNPDNPDTPTANENLEADNFGVYVQDHTIYLSEYRGLVQVYNVAGQCVYNGHATAIPIQQPGVYILRANGQSRKILVK